LIIYSLSRLLTFQSRAPALDRRVEAREAEVEIPAADQPVVATASIETDAATTVTLPSNGIPRYDLLGIHHTLIQVESL
jgi:hypothetical protein